MSHRAHLRTARLDLRPLTAADARPLVAGLDDLAVSRWLTVVPHPYGPADARAFIAASAEAGGPVWAICDADGLCGVITIGDELGFWLAARVWGRGYATEAARVVIADWFADPAAGPLRSGHFAQNLRSRRVLDKLGFRPVGRRARHSLAQGATVESVTMRLTRGRFAAAFGFDVRTPRLHLRGMRAGDAAGLRRIVTDPAVGRMLLVFPPNWSTDAARSFIRGCRWQGTRPFRAAITDRATGAFLGTVGVGGGDLPPVFYFIDPAHAGRGLASEALAAFLPAARAAFGMIALRADVFTDNPASARVLERAGFHRSGLATGHSAARLEPAPIWQYRLDFTATEART